MTLRAAFVQPRHGQSAGAFENIATMRIVALRAIHPAFNHGMMLRQIEFSPSRQVALETRAGIFSGIDNEFASAARGNVFAAGTVT